jgi:hypothetical protein
MVSSFIQRYEDIPHGIGIPPHGSGEPSQGLGLVSLPHASSDRYEQNFISTLGCHERPWDFGFAASPRAPERDEEIGASHNRHATDRGLPLPDPRYPPEPDLTGTPLNQSILENLRKGIVTELYPGLMFNSKEYRVLNLQRNCSKQQLLETIQVMVKEQAEINQLLKAGTSRDYKSTSFQPVLQCKPVDRPTHGSENWRRSPLSVDVHPSSELLPAPSRALNLLQRLKLSGAIT